MKLNIGPYLIEHADYNKDRTKLYLGMELRELICLDLAQNKIEFFMHSYNNEKIVGLVYRATHNCEVLIATFQTACKLYMLHEKRLFPYGTYNLNARKRAVYQKYAIDARFYFTTAYVEPIRLLQLAVPETNLNS